MGRAHGRRKVGKAGKAGREAVGSGRYGGGSGVHARRSIQIPAAVTREQRTQCAERCPASMKGIVYRSAPPATANRETQASRARRAKECAESTAPA